MCMDEVWKPTNILRAICLDPLHLANRESVLEDLQVYISRIQINLDHLLEGAHTWHLVEAVDMVVIPVKVAGTWALYLTQKLTKQQERDQIREGSQEGGREQSRCTGGGFQLGQTHTLYGGKRDGHLAQLVIPQYEGPRSRKLRL